MQFKAHLKCANGIVVNLIPQFVSFVICFGETNKE